MKYSVIVPVYNRPGEVADLLMSLAAQTFKDFEVVLVEDGSSVPCRAEADAARALGLNVKYHYKDNEGRSIARNYGLERAQGEYFIFFDSDCVIPEKYFETVDKALSDKPMDCFGGPDAAHSSFTDVQKAINFSMTSFFTTGGIRGGKRSLEKFVPRTFNMGFSRRVYEDVGGFREMFSEDIDMSTRIKQAGFSIGLIADAAVWHKRRIDFGKFLRQVYVFGMSRITLKLLYPDSLKAVHTLPALLVLGTVALILMAIFFSPWWLTPLAALVMIWFVAAWTDTGSLKIALLAVPACVIQLYGYGCGFIYAYVRKILLGGGRNQAEEVAMRKGK